MKKPKVQDIISDAQYEELNSKVDQDLYDVGKIIRYLTHQFQSADVGILFRAKEIEQLEIKRGRLISELEIASSKFENILLSNESLQQIRG